MSVVHFSANAPDVVLETGLFPAGGHRRRWVVLWSARECLTCTSVSSRHARFLTASSSSSSPLLWVWVADDRGKWEMFEWERWESPCVRFRWGVALRTSNLLLAGRKEAAKQSKEKKGSACKFSFACAQFGPASRTRSSSKLEARYGKKLRESSRPREKKSADKHIISSWSSPNKEGRKKKWIFLLIFRVRGCDRKIRKSAFFPSETVLYHCSNRGSEDRNETEDVFVGGQWTSDHFGHVNTPTGRCFDFSFRHVHTQRHTRSADWVLKRFPTLICSDQEFRRWKRKNKKTKRKTKIQPWKQISCVRSARVPWRSCVGACVGQWPILPEHTHPHVATSVCRRGVSLLECFLACKLVRSSWFGYPEILGQLSHSLYLSLSPDRPLRSSSRGRRTSLSLSPARSKFNCGNFGGVLFSAGVVVWVRGTTPSEGLKIATVVVGRREIRPRETPKRCVVCAEEGTCARCCLLISHEARKGTTGRVCAVCSCDIRSRVPEKVVSVIVYFFCSRKNFGLPDRRDFALAGDLAEQAYTLMWVSELLFWWRYENTHTNTLSLRCLVVPVVLLLYT